MVIAIRGTVGGFTVLFAITGIVFIVTSGSSDNPGMCLFVGLYCLLIGAFMFIVSRLGGWSENVGVNSLKTFGLMCAAFAVAALIGTCFGWM